MSNLCTSNVTSGFIDLATFDELEKYMYGGPDATAYFVRETRKSTWFTQVPVVLSRASGQCDFGSEFSVSISRAGDYLLHAWLRVTFSAITLADNGMPATFTDKRVRWTRNLMHNLIRECCITFNDLVAARFDSYHLDFWLAFTVPAGKRNGYNNMIGNVPGLTFPNSNGDDPTIDSGVAIPSVTLNLPLPLFFTRDSGVALPTAALPYNDMRINFVFQTWQNLLIIDDNGAATAVDPGTSTVAVTNYSRCPVDGDFTVNPSISACQVWANYAIVSNDERKRMACAPRDILIEQVQTAPRQTFNPGQNAQPSFDIRFSHAIKALFFGARNTTLACEWSNYTAGLPLPQAASLEFETVQSLVDPILNTSLVYENTARLSNMGSDYFSLVNPWYHAPHIPMETGYHMYSYSLDFISLDPMGSTNYGKLTNVSIVPQASAIAVAGSNLNVGDTITFSGQPVRQTWDFIVTAVNNNIIRISGGALGFPVL